MLNFSQETSSCLKNLSEIDYEDNVLMYLVQERCVSKVNVLGDKDTDNKGAVTFEE